MDTVQFMLDVVLNALARARVIIAGAPRRILTVMLEVLTSFSFQRLLGDWQGFIVSGASKIADEFQSILRDLGRIPTYAVIQEVRLRINGPPAGSTRVMTGTQAVFFVTDIVALSVTQAATLQLPFIATIAKKVKSFTSLFKTITERLDALTSIRKLINRLYLFAVDFAIVVWNWVLMIFGLLIFASLVERLNEGILDKYCLPQKNPLVKDRSLGRRRQRAASASKAP